ncbi:MAG: NADH:flavin oxidoreductase [Thermodesulfobacteriota bacterium]|nr:NADH:flavin oxidoreductase [Thermodesulfobacteriota bacterium]
MSVLFEASSINNMILDNRFVRSATWEGMANDDGSCTPRLIRLMEKLAYGGVGLIISGHAYVSREGQAGVWQMGIYDEKLVPGLAEMAEAVHRTGGKIIVQLAHAGCHSAIDLTKKEPFGPSIKKGRKGPLCREITREEIRRVVEAFGEGAARARKAGFDGVQIHAAHGYLLSQFLSPFYNKRKDGYGGSIENRARIVLEVFRAVRAQVGEGFPVLIKMNSEDFVPQGLTVDEMVQVAAMLEKAGIDAIELSGGTMFSGKYTAIRKCEIDSHEKEGYYRQAARCYKEKINTPLILVGGIRSYQVAEELVDGNMADYIALCRPLIREPHLINRWESGDKGRALCLSDNLCLRPALTGKGIYCVTEKRLQDNK